MKAIIVDDESDSRITLLGLLKEYFPTVVDVVAVCENAQQGIVSIRQFTPDLVFLDVEMPDMTGFEMLKALGFPNVNFNIIFSSAFPRYGLQAFRFSAIDFLLKPVKIVELIESVMRVQEKMMHNQHEIEIEKYKALIENIEKEDAANGYENRKIVLSTSEGTLFINSDDIIRLEGDGNYTTFYCINKKNIVISKKIGDFNEKKPFFRVHKSYSINPKHVRKINKGEKVQLQMSDNSLVDVARGRKEEVQTFLKDFFYL